MSDIVVGKKTRKKLSAFQKLWERAAKLRKSNEKFRAELDALVGRIEETITPKELEFAAAQKPLLQKLLTFGQRKSLSLWERDTLDDWIREITEDLQLNGLVDDEILDSVSLYDAFRMGITLEDDSIPPREQFAEMLKKAEAERQAQIERYNEELREQSEAAKASLIERAKSDVERELDKLLGPEPSAPKDHSMTEDLWADDLEQEQQRASAEYQARRATLRKQLMAERVKAIDGMLEDEFIDCDDDYDDDFDFDFTSFEEFLNATDSTEVEVNPTSAALNNDTFQRLFRATAGKLHPDRESDPEIRKEKQVLMGNLLKARKAGDVMTILELYETHVGQHNGFSKTDEKELSESLKQMIENLEDEKEEIIFQSPKHSIAHHLFYHRSKRKVSAAIDNHLKQIDRRAKETTSMIAKITSLKTLKPLLRKRYDEAELTEPSFEDFMQFMEDRGMRF